MSFFGFPWIRKKSNPVQERKSLPLGLFSSSLYSYGHYDLAAYVVIGLFCRTAPLGNAIDILSTEFSSLMPQVRDTNKNKVVTNHPVLELLKTPNADSTTAEFLYSLCAFYLITGNSYIVGTGRVNKPPLELWTVFPQQILVEASSTDGLAEVITNQRSTEAVSFRREEVADRFRFYNKDEREIWQIKRFNPSADLLIGQTPASPILPEIDQYNSSSIHNVSLLRRGGRPSGILMASLGKGEEGKRSKPLTDDQYTRLKEQANNFLMGAENAGTIFIAEGANISYKDMITSNRDMDFMKGRQDVRQVIYNRYHIPLPFVNPDRQTFANMGLAKEQLYDNGVLPLADRLFNELSIFLLPRYKGSENLVLTYDKSCIPALQNRQTRDIKQKSETGIYTINELRAFAGMESLDDGGDMLYRPASMVPIAEDQFTEDQHATPQKTSKKKFVEIMSLKGYSAEKIEEMSAVLELR